MDNPFLDTDELAWVNGVPRATHMWIPIASPKPGAPLSLIILDNELHSILTHHFMGRTVPHKRDAAMCEPCKHGFPTRGKVYLPGWLPGPDRKFCIEITPNSIDEYTKLHKKDQPPFQRGWEIRLWRRGKANNSPVVFDLFPSKLREEQLPPPFDVKAALKHIWEGKSKKAPRDMAG